MPDQPPTTSDPAGSPWIRRIKFRHLEMLLAIARHHSLTATAHALDMSQPAVSQWLADIEAAIGAPLFIRGHKLQQTDIAGPVLRHAQRVLNDAARTVAEVDAISRGQRGLVRIGVMQVAASRLLPAAIQQLNNEAAGIELDVVEDVAAGLWARFERGELDLLISRLDQQVLASHYPRLRLFADLHRVVCAPGHPLAAMMKPSWTDAAGYPWLMPPRGTPLRAAIESTFVSAGLQLPVIALSSASAITNQALLRTTNWLGVLSSEAAAYQQGLGVLQALPLTLTPDIGDVGMIWRADSSDDPTFKRVLTVIENALT